MTARGFAPREPWGFVVVEGPDTWRFLQDLVSQDLDPLTDGRGAHSLLLSPQGKLHSDFRILRVDDAAWLDARDGTALATGLGRFRIRVDVEIDDRSEGWALLAVRGVGAEVLGLDLPEPHAHAPVGEARAIRVEWSGVEGFDVVGPAAAVEATRRDLEAAGLGALDALVLERLRIEAGVPLQGVDVDDATIPQEAMLEHDAVSFTKGCFLGQELVCRIDTRGRVTRLLRRVEVDGVLPDAGTELLGEAGRIVGRLTSVAPTPSGSVALATVRHEIEPPATLTLADPPETPARILDLRPST